MQTRLLHSAVLLASLLTVTTLAGCAGTDVGDVRALTSDTSADTSSPPPTEARVDPPVVVRAEPVSTTVVTAPRCASRSGSIRPESGTELVDRQSSGMGALKVSNGSHLDAEVKLVTKGDERVVVDVYVRASEEATLEGIPAGTYRLLFAHGREWDAAATTFACDRSAGQFDEDFPFEEEETATELVSSEWSVELEAVPFGNAPTSPVDPKAFDRY